MSLRRVKLGVCGMAGAALALVMSPSAQAATELYSGLWLAPICQAELWMGAPPGGASLPQCSGAAAVAVFVLENNGEICPPEGAGLAQEVRIVARFLGDQPARLHEPYPVLLKDAFRSAWACKPSPSGP